MTPRRAMASWAVLSIGGWLLVGAAAFGIVALWHAWLAWHTAVGLWLFAVAITIPPAWWVALIAGTALVLLAVRPVASLVGIKRHGRVDDPSDRAAADRP